MNEISVELKLLGSRINYKFLEEEEAEVSLLIKHMLKSVDSINQQDIKTNVLLGVAYYLKEEFDRPHQAVRVIASEILCGEDD